MRTTRFNMKDFGTRLRKLRQACGMTQEEFCDKIGISDTHYRKIEAGSRTGSLELIVEMAEYFHVSWIICCSERWNPTARPKRISWPSLKA